MKGRQAYREIGNIVGEMRNIFQNITAFPLNNLHMYIRGRHCRTLFFLLLQSSISFLFHFKFCVRYFWSEIEVKFLVLNQKQLDWMCYAQWGRSGGPNKYMPMATHPRISRENCSGNIDGLDFDIFC